MYSVCAGEVTQVYYRYVGLSRGTDGDLMVNKRDYRLSGPGLSPDQGHHCVVFTIHSQHPGV